MVRTLQPEDEISHYRVVGPLGAGGMGEVYIARDESLERSVALKVLPHRLVRNEERVRRFIAEAKSASSLNHPNIVTIYEIGHDEVRGSAAGDDADASSEPVHFISMELVSGETLAQKIHAERADLKTLVGYLAQAAEGVAKAHAAGIVHRDLKPGNVMVSADGFAKVLDFGLAKLTEKRAAANEDASSAPTEAAPTGEGVVLGTAGYMSPEQVQGKGVDHRSDVFSLGCILYEAAARKRPFLADTDIEVMHQILREKPQPVEEINPEVPSEIRRVIRRCLAKNPEQRFQSMKDLAIELREAVEEWDSLSASTGSGTSATSGALGVPPGRGATFGAVVGAAAVLALGGLAFGFYSYFGRRAEPAPDQQLEISVLMSRDDFGIASGQGHGVSGGAVLSADGRYLAFTTVEGGDTTLNVRQIRTGSDVQVLPPQRFPVTGISFSPDGDYLHYLNQDPELPNYSALYRVPSLGGTPEKIIFDVDTAAAFSPDGRQVCFRRGFGHLGEDSLVIANLESGEERELLRIETPAFFTGNPSWSPDGERIAMGMLRLEGGVQAWIVSIGVATGQTEQIGTQSWAGIDSLAWSAEGDAVILSAFVFGAQGNQLYSLSWPDGDLQRLTTDLNGYTNVSVAGEGTALTAVRTSDIDNIWVAPLETEAEPMAVTSSTSSANSMGVARPLADGGIAFILPEGDGTVLARMTRDGSERRTLSARGQFVFWAEFHERAGIVFGQVEDEDEAVVHIWRVDPGGSEATRLTSGSGAFPMDLSPTGDLILLRKPNDPQKLWVMKLDGGEPYPLSELKAIDPAVVSPDGRLVLFVVLEQGDREEGFYPRHHLVPVEGGEAVASVLLPPGAATVRWSPDPGYLTYVDRDAGWNLFRHPVGEGGREALTRFDEGRIGDFRWSPDGRQVALLRTFGKTDGLWVLDPESGETRQVTEFKAGSIRTDLRWTWDSQSLVFRHGTTSQDVVMFSGF